MANNRTNSQKERDGLASHLQILCARNKRWNWSRACFPLHAFWSIVAAWASSAVKPCTRACFQRAETNGAKWGRVRFTFSLKPLIRRPSSAYPHQDREGAFADHIIVLK